MDAFHLINRIEALVETGNRVPLTRRVIIEETALFDIIDQLRVSIPDDIKQAQAILQQRDSLLSDAHHQSQKVLEDAEQKAREIIEMSDFVQLAKQRADEVTHDAEQQAHQILVQAEADARAKRQEADIYYLDVLRKLDGQLVSLMHNVRTGIDALESQVGARTGSGQANSQRR
jgi:vacuolar-type H+-ATPase subunit H